MTRLSAASSLAPGDVLTLRDLMRNYPGTQEADLAKKFLRDAGYEK